MTDSEKIEQLEGRIKELESIIPAIEKQRDAALKLLNRRNQELFDDHSSSIG